MLLSRDTIRGQLWGLPNRVKAPLGSNAPGTLGPTEVVDGSLNGVDEPSARDGGDVLAVVPRETDRHVCPELECVSQGPSLTMRPPRQQRVIGVFPAQTDKRRDEVCLARHGFTKGGSDA